MEISINLTLRKILEDYDWDKYCEITGTNPWCINEGRATGDEVVELTVDQAREIGIHLQ